MRRLDKIDRSLLWLLSLVMILAGLGLIAWGWSDLQAEPKTTVLMPEVVAGQAGGDGEAGDQRSTDPNSPLPTPDGAAAVSETVPTVVPTLPALRLGLPDQLPPELQNTVLEWLAQQPGGQVVTDTQVADLWVSVEPGDNLLAERIYVPVARFATQQDEVSAADLLGLWMSGENTGSPSLAVDADAAAGLALLWGQGGQVEVLPDAAAVAAALEPVPGRLGVLPFDQLLPELHAFNMAGQDPTDNSFDAQAYPLAVRLYVHQKPGSEPAAADLLSYVEQKDQQTNRDPQKLTVLMMTGVTAMARMTALRMEQRGYTYPAEVISPTLAAADLTHVSNEIPFVPDCQVNASENNLTLCSKPEYLQALRAVGVDLVGLTGNHLNDFGADDDLWSMQFYQDEQIPTFGGGANLEESLKPLFVEHNGNKLAFLGANQFGPDFAWAKPDSPGSAPYSLPQMTQAITEARQQGADLVLVELQWEESYDTLPIQSQIDGFRALSDAGADIVTGVQSHVPQAVEFRNGRTILYGLGNFFFDQMWSTATRQGLIPRHTFYDGRHLSTKLQTTILEDFAQQRWTTPAERKLLLERIFTASGW